MLEALDFLLAEFFFCGSPDGGVVGLLVFEEVPEDAGQLVGHGGNGFGRAQACFPSAEALTQVIVAAPQTLGCQTQGQGGATLHIAGFNGDDCAAGDTIVWTEAEPGGKAFGGGKTADEVRSQFGEEHQAGVDLDAGHLGEVDSGKAMELSPGIEVGLVALGFVVAEPGRWQWLQIGFAVKAGEGLLEVLIALVNEVLIMPPGAEGLLHDEEVFGPPIPLKTASDQVAGSFDAMIFESGQLLRVAFASEDGVEDGQAGDTGQVTDDVVDLKVHLGEGLLEMLDVAGGITDQRRAMAQDRTDGADVFRWTKAGAQQADRVQVLKPLAIADIGFAAGKIFAMTGVDQADLQAGGFEDLEQRDPVNTGRLHRDGLHATLPQPIAQLEQIVGEGAEGAHRFGIGVGGHGHLYLGGADVDAGGVRMECGQLGVGFDCDFCAGRHKVALVEFNGGRTAPSVWEASETVS